MQEERRIADGVELRQTDRGPVVAGYAARFDVETRLGDGFREVVRRGAFARAIREDDVRALWNHDPRYVLGRTTAGTLRLREDDLGLWYEIDVPDTQWARDVLVTIQRGDVTQSSFGFNAIRQQMQAGQPPLRELLEVRLYDVSPVTYPAYPVTSVTVRSLEAALRTEKAMRESVACAATWHRLRIAERVRI